MGCGNAAGLFQPVRERSHSFDRFQRVLRRHQPPNLVENQVLEREKAQAQVPAMGGIKRTSQQTDPAMPDRRRRVLFDAGQGRT
jgi:hypothetical protein